MISPCRKLCSWAAADPRHSFWLRRLGLCHSQLASVPAGSSLLLSVPFTSSSSSMHPLSIAVVTSPFSPYSFSSGNLFRSQGLKYHHNINDSQTFTPHFPSKLHTCRFISLLAISSYTSVCRSPYAIHKVWLLIPIPCTSPPQNLITWENPPQPPSFYSSFSSTLSVYHLSLSQRRALW